MVYFILNLKKELYDVENQPLDAEGRFIRTSINYAKFLNTELSLGLFIPTDEEGNVLSEPNQEYYEGEYERWQDDLVEYDKALDRVIFEGNWSKWGTAAVLNEKGGKIVLRDKTIQDLVPLGLTLNKDINELIG